MIQNIFDKIKVIIEIIISFREENGDFFPDILNRDGVDHNILGAGSGQDLKNACPKQQFQNFCPSKFSYKSTSYPYNNYIS